MISISNPTIQFTQSSFDGIVRVFGLGSSISGTTQMNFSGVVWAGDVQKQYTATHSSTTSSTNYNYSYALLGILTLST